MLRYVVFCLVGAAAQLTETPRASPVSNRCCDPTVMACMPDMPICPSVTPSEQSCCDPTKTNCPPGIVLCPSQTPSCCDPTKTQCGSTAVLCPSASFTPQPNNSGSCCDPTRNDCGSTALLCPSASFTMSPTSSRTPARTQPNTQFQTPSRTQYPASQCCDPTKTTCSSTSVICPSAPFTPYPTRPSGDCCDPTKSECGSNAVICPSAPYSPRPSASSECCDPTKGSCSDSTFLCASATPFPCCHTECDTSTLPPCFPAACCDPTHADCRNATYICPSFSPYPTRPADCCVSSDVMCPPGQPPCITHSPMPTHHDECCMPEYMNCTESTLPLCPRHCCPPGADSCAATLPPCETYSPMPTGALECCMPMFMNCSESTLPLCPRHCCAADDLSCSDFLPPCETHSPMPTGSVECCMPGFSECDGKLPICPSFMPIPTQLIDCLLNASLCFNQTSGPICPPSMPNCQACCDPRVFECPPNAPICTNTPLPSFTNQCCVPGLIDCRPGMPICNDCCDPNLFDCPSDAPICVNITQLSSPLPSRSQNPTQRPTLLPGIIRASENPTQRPTLLPEATKYVRLRVSARPTPWAVRPTMQPSPLPVIQSKLEFRGANASAFSRPEKIQEVVTNLGCALRLALEQIVIRNITWVSVDGRLTPLPFDPSVAAMRSNGSADCFVADTTAPQQAARRLQATSDSGRVEVDYAITDPPASITTLDSASFSAIVENSPSLQNLAASVGSTGLSAPPPAELTADSGSATASVSNTLMGLPIYGMILLGIFGSLVVGGVAYGAKRSCGASGSASSIVKPPQALVQDGRVIQVVYLSNPLEAKNSIRNNRVDFLPRKVIGKRPVASP